MARSSLCRVTSCSNKRTTCHLARRKFRFTYWSRRRFVEHLRCQNSRLLSF